jgi:hypothetical protein
VLAGGLAVAWNLIPYLIVPVIILEERTTYDSIQCSGELFRKRWGEQIVGDFGFGLLNFIQTIPALMVGLLIFKFDRALAIIVVVWYVLILAAITTAVKGVLTVVLYRYASTGDLPTSFNPRQIEDALPRRRAKALLGRRSVGLLCGLLSGAGR